jgi:hypothetical protein
LLPNFCAFETGFLVQPAQEILQKWNARDRRIHPRMEISGDGLMLGAGTILAKTALDSRGARLTLDDEPRAMALLSTACKQSVGPFAVAKMRRACELWNEGEQALAYIHLAHIGLPPCDEDRALRLFVADELLESGVTPQALLKAQGFDPASPIPAEVQSRSAAGPCWKRPRERALDC